MRLLNFKKTFLIFLVLLCVASVGIASVSASSDIASDDAIQSAIDDNAIDELILEETDNSVSDNLESPIGDAESAIDDSISETDGDESLDPSILKDGETTIYVSGQGDDTKDGLTEENAVATVSKAYELASDGSTINIGAGTYTVNGITVSKSIIIKANEAGTVILDGNNQKMFTVNSPAELTLLNLVLRNGGTQEGGFVALYGEGTLNLINSTVKDLRSQGAGGLVYLSSSGKLNIEGSHIENISSSNAAIIHAIRDNPEIIIKDSSFDNINNTDYWGNSALIDMRGNLTIERSNFTNIIGKESDSFAYGAISSTFLSNYYISECQFINITGGWGSALCFYNGGNITVTKSVFMNNKNYRGAIYLSDNPASSNINYNLFIDNVALGNNARDLFINSANNLNADYNFWGTNSQPTASQITNVDKASCWTIVELSSGNVYLGTSSAIDVKFMGTDGVESIPLGEAMPEYDFDLSASSGTIEPTATVVNNVATISYTPETTGTVTITANPGSAALEFNVVDPSILLVVSNDGSDETGDGTLNNPYATIAKALSQVTESRNVVYLLKSENAYKEHDLTVAGNAIIQGEDKTVTVDGENAGRIFIVTGNSIIRDLKLINGQSDATGGAIYVDGGSLTLSSVEISNSKALNGGAIGTSEGSSLTVTDSIFTGNEASNGGAIYIDTESAVDISSNSFASNTATKGEAIYIKGAAVTLSDNTMTESKPIYLESGSVNSILTFLSNSTIYKEFGETIELTATLTDDKGNVIRGGSVVFTADGETVGTVDLSGDSPLQISYTVPLETEVDVIISGSYTLDNGGTVLNGAIHPPILYWFIEGGNGYETLSEAVEAAQSGDVISGKAGTYIVNGITISKDLTIKANETETIILDGNKNGMFTVSPSTTLTLINLDLTNGGSSGGGFVDMHGSTLNLIDCTLRNIESARRGIAISSDSSCIMNIERSCFEDFNSTATAIYSVIYTPADYSSVVTIKDSIFNNINSKAIEISDNLTVERTNFTNIQAGSGYLFAGAVSLYGYHNNALISQCQFINITGGRGSAIHFNAGNLTVTKSLFMNNSNTEGTIYLSENPASANINYNLFINNVCSDSSGSKDVYVMNVSSNVNADYNFWGTNSQPTSSQINNLEKMSYWTIVDLSASGSNVIFADTSSIYVKFIGTNGVENVTLLEAMPEYDFDLSASSGSISPGTVTLVNNEAIATYTPAVIGTVTITASPGPAELVLDVIDPSDLIVVSNDGSDETGDGTLNNPYATIAKALSQVTESRNVIYILKSENAYKEHDLTISENVTIKCEDKTVTIDGENAGRIFIVTGTARIEDLTLMNGQSSENGGAIYVNGGDLTLSNCVFASNTAAKGEAIYMESGSLSLSGNTIADDETIYIAGGTVNSILKFLNNDTIKAEIGETFTLNATLTDDKGNVIRGGSVIFTANGETVGTVDLSGDNPLEISYIVPMVDSGNIVISGSYSLDNGGTVESATLIPITFNWFIEGGDRYETLEEAIEAAENGDVIYGNPGTYDISRIDIDKNITIKANESGSIIINGNGKKIFTISADVILENLTFINGTATDNGGIILANKGSLVLNNTVFKDIQATSGQGSAIYVSSGFNNVTIENSSFDNINAASALIYCRSSSTTFTVIKTNFTNINVNTYGLFYFYEGGINLSESRFINITGERGVIAYFWGLNDNIITKCLFDNVTTADNNGIIYSNSKTVNVSYNVFLGINKGIYSSNSGRPVTADYNYWGSNDPSSYVNSNTVLNNWVIMTVNPVSANGIVGEPIEITIDFKHIINAAGEIADLEDTLPEFTVYAESNDGTLSQAEATVVDSQAKIAFTPLLRGENIANIICGNQIVPVVVNAIKTSINLQQLIDSTPEGGVLDLSNDRFENVSGINITKAIAIVCDNVSILTAGDGNPVFNIASDAGNVSISGVEFIANNGDVLVKATAANGTDDLSIVNPAIEITNNTVTPANDAVVASSVTLFELESERAVLAPSNPISIAENSLPEGAKAFDFEISGLNDGSGIDIPTGGNINTNGSGESPIDKVATTIVCNNMKTTTVVTKINGKNAGKNFSITLKDNDGNVLSGKQVIISFNGKIYNCTTNDKGVASVKVALSKKGTYPVVVSFLGDDKYNGSLAIAKVTVSPQKVKLTVAKKTYKESKTTKILTATLKATNKKAIKGKKLVFTVNGKKYTAKTNKKGIAKVKVKLSRKKTYKFTVKFAGDSTYKKISKKSKVVIK